MGVTFANIICRIFALLKQHWLWIVAVNAFGMTLDISLWLTIVKMPYCVWPEEHKPTTNSPNIERIIEDHLEDNANGGNKVVASTKGIVAKHIDLK